MGAARGRNGKGQLHRDFELRAKIEVVHTSYQTGEIKKNRGERVSLSEARRFLATKK